MDFSSSPHKRPILHSSSSSSSRREHMFEKVVTPSDVGKLNRLVIPKQHAEKYFPLDSASGEKGFLLNFDETSASGKSWRFRYSYWSSSQSYVITKGWSRFVKDKQLFAGDVVSFLRDSSAGRLFIDWRRRPVSVDSSRGIQFHHGINFQRPIHHLPHHIHSWSSSVTPAPLLVGPPYGYGYGAFSNPGYSRLVGPKPEPASSSSSPKRLRLFGVNMDCHDVVFTPSSSSSSSALPTSSAASKINLVTANFLDKGKSSLSLDFGFSSDRF